SRERIRECALAESALGRLMTSASIRRSAAADACEYPTMLCCAGSMAGSVISTAMASFVIEESEGLIESLRENSLQRRVIAGLIGSGSLNRRKLALHFRFDKRRRLFHSQGVQ